MSGPAASRESFAVAPNGKPNSRPQTSQKSPATQEDHFPLPSNLLRLNNTPILCFQRLADDFNRTMLRLKETANRGVNRQRRRRRDS